MTEAQAVEPSTTAVVDEDPKPAETAPPAQAPAPAPAPAQVGPQGLIFTNIDEMWKFAVFAHKSGWSPKNATPESNIVAMQFGAELGVNAMQSIQNITPIKGRPCAWGDLPLGICMSSPYFDHAEFREWYTGTPGADDYTAHCRARRHGGNVTETEFSVVDAKRAGLWEGARSLGKDQKLSDTIWYKYFKRMLKYRARGYCLRDTFPDVLKGLHTGEEMSDVDQIMSRMDLGRRSEPAAAESPADLRKRLTDPEKKPKPRGSKKASKPEAAESAQPPPGNDQADDPEFLRKVIMDKWRRINKAEHKRILNNLGIIGITVVNTMTDIDDLRSINEALAGEIPPDNG